MCFISYTITHPDNYRDTKNAQKTQRHFINNKYVRHLQIKFSLAKVEYLIIVKKII